MCTARVERKVAECVFRREEMIIVAIITLLVIVLAGWAICAAIPREPWEDQEQEDFLKKWRKKHK